jgi:hypothetical protein
MFQNHPSSLSVAFEAHSVRETGQSHLEFAPAAVCWLRALDRSALNTSMTTWLWHWEVSILTQIRRDARKTRR